MDLPLYAVPPGAPVKAPSWVRRWIPQEFSHSPARSWLSPNPNIRNSPTVVLGAQLLRGASSATSSITAKIYAACNASRLTLLLSEPILREVEDVMARPEVLRKPRMTPIEAAALIELLRRQTRLVTPTVRIRRSRDAADDKFLECAAAGGAGHIVSANADLLSLQETQGIPIIDAPAFWGTLTREGRP